MNSIVVLRVILYLFRNEDLINKNRLHFLCKIIFFDMLLKLVFFYATEICVYGISCLTVHVCSPVTTCTLS